MGNFVIDTVVYDKTLVVKTNGYLDEHGGAVLFETIEKSISEGYKYFVLDFASSPVINSQGISQILEVCEIVCEDLCGRVAFVGLSELAKNVFKMVGLLEMTDLYDDENQAVLAYSGNN